MRRMVPSLLLAVLLCLAAPGAALAQSGYTGVPIAHRETVQAGPYTLTVGVSEWPMRSQRSVDLVFQPEGGIDGKDGTVTLVAPSGQERSSGLVRHPRMPTWWGLDVIALPEEGTWTWRFAVNGPQGHGTGSVAVTLGPRPGPPAAVAWIAPVLVAVALVAVTATAWRRVRPADRPEAASWTLPRPHPRHRP